MAWKRGKPQKRPGYMKRWSSDNIKTKSTVQTPVARTYSESREKNAQGTGAAVLYRDHIKSGSGYMSPKGRFIPAKKVPPTRLIIEEYKHMKQEDKPPIVQKIEKDTQSEQYFADHRVGWNHWHTVYLCNDLYHKFMMCFSGQKAIFISHDLLLKTMKLSRFYTTERAREIIRREQWGIITWDEKATLP